MDVRVPCLASAPRFRLPRPAAIGAWMIFGGRKADGRDARARFDAIVGPHLDSGLNLALWLIGDRQDAEDALQNAAVRAFRALDSLRVADARPWFLAIVRNECLDVLRERARRAGRELRFDEDLDGVPAASDAGDPELPADWSPAALVGAIDGLPPGLREVLLLREMEDMSYRQIAEVVGKPIGTVMSRLSRARSALARALSDREDRR